MSQHAGESLSEQFQEQQCSRTRHSATAAADHGDVAAAAAEHAAVMQMHEMVAALVVLAVKLSAAV